MTLHEFRELTKDLPGSFDLVVDIEREDPDSEPDHNYIIHSAKVSYELHQPKRDCCPLMLPSTINLVINI